MNSKLDNDISKLDQQIASLQTQLSSRGYSQRARRHARLDETTKQALIACFAAGMEAPMVAETFGVSAPTAYVYRRKALAA